MHRCVDQMKKILQSISESQDNFKDFMIQKATIKLQVNHISRNVEEIIHTVNTVSESQDSIKSILKDLYDIINDMNNPNRGDSPDLELLQKINDSSNRMTQANLGQESVKEVMTEEHFGKKARKQQERVLPDHRLIHHTMKKKSSIPGYPVT